MDVGSYRTQKYIVCRHKSMQQQQIYSFERVSGLADDME